MIAKLIRKLNDRLRNPSRVVGGGVMALGAVVVGAWVRRRRPGHLPLPDAGEIASETGLSVSNATKGAVIAAVREADRPDIVLLRNTVNEAMREGAAAGADLAAVAVGAVGGAVEISRLVGEEPLVAASAAGRAAMEVAEAQGTVAAARIHDLLSAAGVPA